MFSLYNLGQNQYIPAIPGSCNADLQFEKFLFYPLHGHFWALTQVSLKPLMGSLTKGKLWYMIFINTLKANVYDTINTLSATVCHTINTL